MRKGKFGTFKNLDDYLNQPEASEEEKLINDFHKRGVKEMLEEREKEERENKNRLYGETLDMFVKDILELMQTKKYVYVINTPIMMLQLLTDTLGIMGKLTEEELENEQWYYSYWFKDMVKQRLDGIDILYYEVLRVRDTINK